MKIAAKDIKTLTAECLAFEQQIRELGMGGKIPDVKEMILWSANVAGHVMDDIHRIAACVGMTPFVIAALRYVADSIETNASQHAKGLPEVSKHIREGLDEILTTVSVVTNGEDPFVKGGDEE